MAHFTVEVQPVLAPSFMSSLLSMKRA